MIPWLFLLDMLGRCFTTERLIFMKIDFIELARIENQEVPPVMAEHLQALSERANIGVKTLQNLPAHIRSSQMRNGRLNNAIDNSLEKSRVTYEACVLAKHLLDKRQQAVESQYEDLSLALSEHIPEHDSALQKQLADATLAGDTKAADQAVAALQKLRQRTEQKGEIESRISTMKALLDTFTLTKEVLTAIMGKISPTLWREHAESLLVEYREMRQQMADFVELHHQIRACEWLGKDAYPHGHASPLQDTVKLFEFDQERQKQAFAVLRPIVLLE